MIVSELRQILKDIEGDVQVMIMIDDGNPSIMEAAQGIYLDCGGSSPILCLGLYGNKIKDTDSRKELTGNNAEEVSKALDEFLESGRVQQCMSEINS